MKVKNNIFIGFYILITAIYNYINKNIYEGILIPIEILGIIFIIASIIYTIFFNGMFNKIYLGTNMCVIFLLILLFLLNSPQYTYNEAKDIISSNMKNKGEVVDIYKHDDSYSQLIGIGHINLIPKRNLLIKADYLIYFYNNTTQTLICFRVNPINGQYKIYSSERV